MWSLPSIKYFGIDVKVILKNIYILEDFVAFWWSIVIFCCLFKQNLPCIFFIFFFIIFFLDILQFFFCHFWTLKIAWHGVTQELDKTEKIVKKFVKQKKIVANKMYWRKKSTTKKCYKRYFVTKQIVTKKISDQQNSLPKHSVTQICNKIICLTKRIFTTNLWQKK